MQVRAADLKKGMRFKAVKRDHVDWDYLKKYGPVITVYQTIDDHIEISRDGTYATLGDLNKDFVIYLV